jgi:hypothetical protein
VTKKKNGMGWAGYVARTREKIRAYRVVVGKLEGKRIFGSLRNRRDGNNIMDRKKYGRKAWTGLIWLRTRKSG